MPHPTRWLWNSECVDTMPFRRGNQNTYSTPVAGDSVGIWVWGVEKILPIILAKLGTKVLEGQQVTAMNTATTLMKLRVVSIF